MASFLFAFPGRAHRREYLAETFWPELNQARSRAAFNSAIWRLRKLIGREPASRGGDNLRTAGTEIVLEPRPWMEIDTRLLESAVTESAAANRGPTVRQLQLAVDRYEGPFLDGEESCWALEERERLHSIFVRLATVLVRHCAKAREYDAAISLARRVLKFDPYRESMVRSLLILLSLDDQRGEALRFYQRWAKQLHVELGVIPMPATSALAGLIRNCQTTDEFEALRQTVLLGPADSDRT